jgi:hypothetical protein
MHNILRFSQLALVVVLLMPYTTALMRQDTSQDGTGCESSSRSTVYEAADTLGITVDAIMKRIQRGTIPYERHADGRVYVLLDGLEGVRDKSSNVASLQDQVEYLRGELAIRAEELRRKDHIIAAFTERIPAQEAPRDASEGRETASTSPEGVQGSSPDAVGPSA